MRIGHPWTAVLLLAACTAIDAPAQPSFSSGSTNADGALNITTNTTITGLSASGNNIYNYTTINIAAGVTVTLSGQYVNGPVYWLASGAVTIAGTLNLNGQQGASNAQSEELRQPAYPGAGGYAGGVGGRASSPVDPAQPGSGPGGGAAGTNSNNTGQGGTLAGSNTYLVPLVGGSGGGGAYQNSTVNYGPGGGGGGGAILIASSASINLTGSIQANGGNQGTPFGVYAGGGAGGAVHLIAPTVTGGGSIQTTGGSPNPASTNGLIRIEATTYNNTLTLTAPYIVTSTPNLYLPNTASPQITVVSVAGTNVAASPTGSFVTPDVTINNSAAVPVVIDASNIPVGTVLTLQFISDGGTDFTVTAPATTGSLAQSTTTAQVIFPAGFTRGYVIASW